MAPDHDDDYPAAHSMDTEWFAVDADGHVAFFETGEAGAVPEAAYLKEGEAHAALRRWAASLPRTEPVFELPTREAEEPVHMCGPEETYREGVLVFLDSADLLRDEVERGLAVVCRAPACAVVYFREFPRDVSERLHAAGLCLGCVHEWDWEEDEDRPDPAAFGFFTYGQYLGNIFTSPYRRDRRPLDPVRVEQLPPELRAVVERFRFTGLCFFETDRLQPVDHGTCATWDCAYLGVDEKTVRPVSGREDEYRERYEDLRDDPSVDAEPPPP